MLFEIIGNILEKIPLMSSLTMPMSESEYSDKVCSKRRRVRFEQDHDDHDIHDHYEYDKSDEPDEPDEPDKHIHNSSGSANKIIRIDLEGVESDKCKSEEKKKSNIKSSASKLDLSSIFVPIERDVIAQSELSLLGKYPSFEELGLVLTPGRNGSYNVTQRPYYFSK